MPSDAVSSQQNERSEPRRVTADIPSSFEARPWALRNVWRNHAAENLVAWPHYCAADAPVKACHASCDLSRLEANATLLGAVWNDITGSGGTNGTYDAAAKLRVVAALCETPTSIGEQAESASPLDPAFWAIHPTIERLYQWRKLTGGFDDDAWHDDGSAACVYGARCYGHQPDDEVGRRRVSPPRHRRVAAASPRGGVRGVAFGVFSRFSSPGIQFSLVPARSVVPWWFLSFGLREDDAPTVRPGCPRAYVGLASCVVPPSSSSGAPLARRRHTKKNLSRLPSRSRSRASPRASRCAARRLACNRRVSHRRVTAVPQGAALRLRRV